MMLVETDAVIAEAVHFLPGIEMLGVGANGDVGLEVTVRQRIGEFAADLEMVKLFAVGEQIEDENFHGRASPKNLAILLVGGIRGQVTARAGPPAQKKKKFVGWGGGGFVGGFGVPGGGGGDLLGKEAFSDRWPSLSDGGWGGDVFWAPVPVRGWRRGLW